MAIYFYTERPRELLETFDARISQSEERGRIETWIKSNDGATYTHRALGWSQKSWLKPRIDEDKLTFNIIRPEDRYVSVASYAFFYSQLVETFVNHLELDCDSITVTPRCTDGDIWS